MRLMIACAPLLDPINKAVLAPGFVGRLRPSPETLYLGKNCHAVAASSTQRKSSGYLIEFLNDSGAGRTILSKRALKEQGVPASAIDPFITTASQPISFDTGGGERSSNKSIALTGGLLHNVESYMLEDSPIAISMGQLVESAKLPFIWVPGDKPYHCTDASKLRVSCPMRYPKLRRSSPK